MIISPPYETEAGKEELGGKGYNLQMLKSAGYDVPDFVIITSSFFEPIRTRDEVAEYISPLLEEIKLFLKENQFAVRSSAVSEDGKEFSYAGQFLSILNVPYSSLAFAVADVYESRLSHRLSAYQEFTGQTEVKMAVIIQQMIPATASGVAFGINPLTGNKEEYLIHAINGLGEALVSGSVNADTYLMKKESLVQKKIIGDSAVLSDVQLLKVQEHLQKLNNFFGGPQDIEFAFVGNEFFLLQSRPVTAVRKEELIIWDNSNIVESYPGLTLPLSFSFIQKMYEAVYRQFSRLLGVPQKKIDHYASVYANMLGLLNGRVYYNLNSWYRALAQLPGYSVNAGFMEKMMGVKEKFELENDSHRSKAGIGSYLEIINAVVCILRNLQTVRLQKKRFVRDFAGVYQHFNTKDYDTLPAHEIWNDYRQFEKLMVSRWKAPLVNDFFAMIYFGLLQKLCLRYFPQQPDIHNKLLASSKDISTTEPLKQLPQLTGLIHSNEELNNIFLYSSPIQVWESLQQPRFEKYLHAIKAYLEAWGERCVAELKLETITYSQEPQRLIAILQSYLTEGIFSFKESVEADKERRLAELLVQKTIRNPIHKAIFRHVLHKARYLVSNRENLRYYRTRGFGMVRRMMMALGKQLAGAGLIELERDIFYLELSQIEEAVKGEENRADLKQSISERKKEYQLFEQLSLPGRIRTYGQPGKMILEEDVKGGDEGQKIFELIGIPCSPGVVHATVCPLRDVNSLKTLNRMILATYATDPGWVVLFPSAAGILTERGSLLSHAAIVSREMGIPCIVGVEGLMQTLREGDELVMDGSTGLIKILNRRQQ